MLLRQKLFSICIYILLLFGLRTKYFLGPENEKLNSKTSNFVVSVHFKNVPPKINQAPFFLKDIPQRNPFPGENYPLRGINQSH